jgi:hypothetical protein
MAQTDDGVPFELLVQNVAAHQFAQSPENVGEIVEQLSAAAALRDQRLIQNDRRLKRIQLPPEENPGMVLRHQFISHELSHVLDVLVNAAACKDIFNDFVADNAKAGVLVGHLRQPERVAHAGVGNSLDDMVHLLLAHPGKLALRFLGRADQLPDLLHGQ